MQEAGEGLPESIRHRGEEPTVMEAWSRARAMAPVTGTYRPGQRPHDTV